MRTLGNLIWFVFGGAITGILWEIAGVLWAITVMTDIQVDYLKDRLGRNSLRE